MRDGLIIRVMAIWAMGLLCACMVIVPGNMDRDDTAASDPGVEQDGDLSFTTGPAPSGEKAGPGYVPQEPSGEEVLFETPVEGGTLAEPEDIADNEIVLPIEGSKNEPPENWTHDGNFSYMVPPPIFVSIEDWAENGSTNEPWGGYRFGTYLGRDSPEIFFHVQDDVTTDVRVTIRDGVTSTIPVVAIGDSAEWSDVAVSPDGTINYDEDRYEYLYYEGRFTHLYGDSAFGWVVEKHDGVMFLDSRPIDDKGLLSFISSEMSRSGLEDNEVQVMLDRISRLDMLDFDGPYLLIRYIPMVQVNSAMTLETSHEFSIMRRHLLIEESSERVELAEPLYEFVPDDGYVIHETAVNRI